MANSGQNPETTEVVPPVTTKVTRGVSLVLGAVGVVRR